MRPNLTTINLLKKNSQVFRRRLITTDRLPVCEHFGADIVTLIITSRKRIVTVLTFLSLQICPAVFVHLLTISHLCRRLRTHLNLRGNTGYVYYSCTCVLYLLCLFITTNTLLLEQDVATVKDGHIFFRRFLKIICGLVNKVTSHKFSVVNFALGCQNFLHRLWYYWMINHFYVSCK